MYTQDGKIADRREMLKIKIKSLAEESRIIRFQEKRSHGQLRDEMHLHRINVVRFESRVSQIAYALIRGKDPLKADPHCEHLVSCERVTAMVKKYGPLPPKLKAVA